MVVRPRQADDEEAHQIGEGLAPQAADLRPQSDGEATIRSNAGKQSPEPRLKHRLRLLEPGASARRLAPFRSVSNQPPTGRYDRRYPADTTRPELSIVGPASRSEPTMMLGSRSSCEPLEPEKPARGRASRNTVSPS